MLPSLVKETLTSRKGTLVVRKKMLTSINTFIMWDISI